MIKERGGERGGEKGRKEVREGEKGQGWSKQGCDEDRKRGRRKVAGRGEG